MTKSEFLSSLIHRLGYLPYDEVKRTVDFYREAIEDRIEDGMSEAEAVAAVGDLDDIVREIEMNLPLSTVVKTRVDDARERARESRRASKGGEWAFKIFFLILTSPIWFSLLIAGAAVVLSIFVALFSVVFAFGVAATALITGGAVTAVTAFVLPYPGLSPRLMLSGIGLVLAALGLLLVPVAGFVERVVRGCLRYTVRVVKGSILRGRGAEA